MPKSRATAFATVLVACGLASTAQATAATTIDFEGLQPGWYPGSLSTQGFVLDPGSLGAGTVTGYSGHYGIASPTDPSWFSNNGTNFFEFDYFLDDSILNIYGDRNQVFGVSSMDLGVASISTVANQGLSSCAAWSGPAYSMAVTG